MACDRIEAIETISTLAERLQTSTLLTDRRDTCRSLRSLAKDYRVEVGAQAMEPMLQTIKNDSYDTDIVIYCLEALNYIISGPLADSPAATWSDSEQIDSSNLNVQGGRELSEIFLKKAENLTIVLDMTCDKNPKIRWIVLRILCGLVRQKPELVQEYIISDSMKLTNLTQLLSEEHEWIRNDALVLFVNLTQTNQTIQNIVAYASYDKIFHIIQSEGYLEGSIAVVNDCLNILLNLVQYNKSNQLLFRESGHIERLLPFFNTIPTIQWTIDRTACLVLVLQIIDSMLSGINNDKSNSQLDEDTRRCQNIIRGCGLFDKLCELLTAGSLPIMVYSETMNTASKVVHGHLGTIATKEMPTSSLMPILLLSMCREMSQDQKQRLAEVTEMCQEQERKVSQMSERCQDLERRMSEMFLDQERRISELYNYMHVLHDFVSKKS